MDLIHKRGMTYVYTSLLIIRFLLTLYPQKGYIHPDEHFQYPEVVYGDLLQVHSYRSWEFTCMEPIRSIAFPYIIVGIPCIILKAVGSDSLYGTPTFPYFLLVLPRLVMCCLSLVHDVCLIKICKLTGENHIYRLVIFASSYVTLTYLTRTLSNSVEAALFTLLIYIIYKDLNGYVSDCKKMYSSENHVSQGYLVGVLITCGCFVRPTFLLFAVAPVIFWLISTGRLSLSIVSFVRNLMWYLPGVLVTAVGLIVVDTVYYNDDYFLLDGSLIFNALERLVVTPINFIQYNLNFSRVRTHGDHPWYLHFLVNMHIVFPVLGLFGLIHIIRVLRYIRSKGRKRNYLEELMLICFVSPVILLSVIPHQEPRFITPVLFPLVCLCTRNLLPCNKYKACTILWFLANVLGTIFFGFVHQGGLSSALSSLSLELNKQDTETNIVFYHTYMPPRYLMAVPSSKHNIQVHDLFGSEEKILFSKLSTIIHSSESSSRLYVVSPGTLHTSFAKFNSSLSSTVKLTISETFFPHFSTEDPPSITVLLKSLRESSMNYQKVRDLFSLNLYRIQILK